MKLVALVTGLLLLAAPAAEAKFRISLAVEPAQVSAKQPARVTVRTGIELPREHGLQLHVAGPWHASHGTPFFEARLHRIGPTAFRATVRFPRAGRWRLIVPNWNDQGSTSPPPAERTVRVRPGA
jgi:hypothetical protein